MKSEDELRPDVHTAISDYPDLISDTSVVFGHARLITDGIVDNIGDEAGLAMQYDDDKKVDSFTQGRRFSSADIGNEPSIQLIRADPSAVYTLMLLDVDFPSPHAPKYRSTLVLMVNNIKGKVDEGHFSVEYMAPEPQAHGGEHRFVALIFKQKSYIQDAVDSCPPARRVGFQPKQWAKERGMGNPVGGLYFRVMHDKS